MAKKAKKESKKEVEYVASGLNIKYSVPVGLASMLATVTKSSKKEVWCKLSDIANICAVRLVDRLDKKTRYSSASSWTTQTFPGSDVKLRLDMDGWAELYYFDPEQKKHIELKEPRLRFSCRVKVSGTSSEIFTQQQINDYITDKILLGDDDELAGVPEAETSSEQS